MSAQVLAAIIVGLVVLLILLFLYWNCRCRSEPTSTPRRPRGGKDELHGGQAHNRLQNAPPPPDHSRLIVRADELHGGQAQNGQRNAPPPPPAFSNNNGGTNSSSSGPDNPLPPPPPPPPPPPAFSNNNGGTNSSSSGPDNSLPPQPLIIVFTYEELARATDGFTDANLLGQGGFGYVHRGVLPDSKEIAVKQLKSGSGQGEREFQAEVEIISRVHHRHLVRLIGYCIYKKKRLLVYEFVPNNTLHFHLHGEGKPTMDWPTRLKIALGSAKGLAYLHEDCIPKIIHRDIKGTNILLNFDFEVKIADFGLAKIVPDNNTHVTTRIMGTYGYLAPEYFFSGKLTDKSDVYSFGVMLLELITGRRPIAKQGPSNNSLQEAIVVWAKRWLTGALEGNYKPLVDPRLPKDYNCNEMKRMVACAAACVRETAEDRPRMSLVVKVLEGDVSPENLKVGAPPMRTGRT